MATKSTARVVKKAPTKKKIVQNTFELVQFKKMIGKGLVEPFKGVPQVVDPELKNKIVSKSVKSIAMTGFVNAGIVYIFDGVDRLLAINSISYAEIKRIGLEVDIVINQHSKMAMSDLLSI